MTAGPGAPADAGMLASASLTPNRGTGTPKPMARPKRGHEHFVAKLLPDQAKALRDAALRAKLDELPNAADGASLIVRELVQGWIDAGARWPVPRAPASRASSRRRRSP